MMELSNQFYYDNLSAFPFYQDARVLPIGFVDGVPVFEGDVSLRFYDLQDWSWFDETHPEDIP